MHKKFVFLFFLFFASVAVAQTRKYEKHLINNLININYPDSTVTAEIYHKEKEVKPRINRYYIWYRANDIKITRGGFDGRLIHGDYKVFYHDKSLKEQGKVRKGQKKGRWIRWYANGEIYEIMHWKKGQQHGVFEVFNDTGKLLTKGHNKKGKVHGLLTAYDSTGNVISIKKYKSGEFVENVEIPEKKVRQTRKPKEKKDQQNNPTGIEEKPIENSQKVSTENPTKPTALEAKKSGWKNTLKKPFSWVRNKFKKKENPQPAQ